LWDSNGKINNLLERARIVVSSGSTTALESVIKGLPVIFMFSHQEIDTCPYEFLDQRMYGVVFDENELMNKIHEWSPNHPLNREIRLKIGNNLLIESFEKPNKYNMNKFNCF
jgi:predicted glycosyltransferase